MSASSVAAAVLFALVATISPGGATTLAAASGSRFGVRRSLPLLGGISVGLATLAAGSALGLAGLVLAVPGLQLAIRLVGSAYLLWLAWGTARRGRPHGPDVDRPRRFTTGVVLLWLNPKGWAMTLAAAAAFGDAVAGPSRTAVLLGGVFGVASATSLLLWCGTGTVLARLITTDAGWRRLNVVLAVLLVASIVPMWLE